MSNPSSRNTKFTSLILSLVTGLLLPRAVAAWQPASNPIMTQWAEEVSPENAHPEYPRPQMVRSEWKNLNGLWEYAVTPKSTEAPADFAGEILVPYPVESALSGVRKRIDENERLWYRRQFDVPEAWREKQLLLHFGGVDWETTVYVNGREIGLHRGGYDAFSFDITDALKQAGPQEIVVSVWDPTDTGYQPRGKQVKNPGGIMYTPTTGIWQTVWLEPVTPSHLESIRITPDFDNSSVTVQAQALAGGGQAGFQVEILDGANVIQQGRIDTIRATRSIPPQIAPSLTLSVPDAKPWSPDSPFLYGVRLTQFEEGEPVDVVESYFGMRKISTGEDADGIQRLFLNNEVLFQYGPLDQGFWPDGLYTAPTDTALRFDIEKTRELGFNMARKHVKVEPARWYYWCDKLGLLVWQDMPSGNFGGGENDERVSDESARQYDRELRAMVGGLYNHPCVVMWIPFNEGWGQHETARIVKLIKNLDPTRPVNEASGWHNRGSGDIRDIHSYPGPDAPPLEDDRVGVLGEFGGLGLPVGGHTWQDEANWGYRSYTTSEELTEAYLALLRKLHPLTGARGLSAAVYTQTTDVEVEVNGLMTYDRAMVKMDAELITVANQDLYTPPAPRRAEGNKLIPPATPLVACDPYFSIWSPANELNGQDTVHWTGKPHRLTSMIRIDGKAYRVMGASPSRVPALPQTSLNVMPTRTIYAFEGAGIALNLTFMTAALPEDIDLLSRPVTYLTYDFQATDGRVHDVQLYFDAMGELAVNTPDQAVEWKTESMGKLRAIRIGSVEQPVLAKPGDDIRIDWGYFYLAAPRSWMAANVFTPRTVAHRSFVENGLTSVRGPGLEIPANGGELCAASAIQVGRVGERPVSRWLMLAYDDLYSIQYMKKNLRPYWRRNGWEAADLLEAAANDYTDLAERCAAFDAELMQDLREAGGEKYAKIAALAYRQCFAASKFVADANGQPLSFSKENHSNGCIGTSDVFYPMAPQFLLFGPSVAKSFLVPFMNYAVSERWRFPFAPHDLGQYPHANGQRYGGGEQSEENQMPVEESGNLLILMAAVAEIEGHPGFAELYWPTLTQWAEYLKAKGFDPENQLCTDDFAGHLAHNVNLSAKAICGLAAYANLCARRGDTATAAEYQDTAQQFARKWMNEADDGDHYRLAFDKPGTWSQKYNLVWDRILNLDLWPARVRRTEMDYYKSVQNRYGLPLDNRSLYTKLDWILWTATLTQKREDFESLVAPVFRFLNETPDRVPMTDWYWTHNARRRGFTARPVVGGVFLPLLYRPEVWKKYTARDLTRASGYAPMPKAPIVRQVIPTSEKEGLVWRYTTERPSGNWFMPDFNDGQWREGRAGFGTRGTPGARVRTTWNSRHIWLRRQFQWESRPSGKLHLRMHHDEDAEVYLNGVLAARTTGYTTGYEEFPIRDAAQQSLQPGQNTIAIHCQQTGGGQYIDAGLANVVPVED